MRWISIDDRLPDKAGKYIVKTKTFLGYNRFEATLHVSDSKRTWDVSNQVVIEWLEE